MKRNWVNKQVCKHMFSGYLWPCRSLENIQSFSNQEWIEFPEVFCTYEAIYTAYGKNGSLLNYTYRHTHFCRVVNHFLRTSIIILTTLNCNCLFICSSFLLYSEFLEPRLYFTLLSVCRTSHSSQHVKIDIEQRVVN
jgi:hypothetical protein